MSLIMSFVFALVLLQFSPNAHADRLQTAYLQRIDQPSEMVTLDYQTKATLLAIWKADCQGCDLSLLEADKALQELKAKGLQAYGIYADLWESYQDRAKFQNHSHLPQLHDAGFRFSQIFAWPRPPTWVLVGKGGAIVGRAETAPQREDLLRQVRKILSDKKD
jgi:peroxiredoxin